MKQLKSTLSDLRELFDRSITLRHIAEPLVCYSFGDSAADALKYMQDHRFDIVGVTSRSIPRGYVPCTIPPRGKVGRYLQPFAQEDILLATIRRFRAFSTYSPRAPGFLSARTGQSAES